MTKTKDQIRAICLGCSGPEMCPGEITAGDVLALLDEVERLRETLKTAEQAVREMGHAHSEPNWFTDGKPGADAQFRLWERKAKTAFTAIQESQS